MKSMRPHPEKAPELRFTSAAEQIEEINLKRVQGTCIGAQAAQLVNIFNPTCWNSPRFWAATVYLILTAAIFWHLAYLGRTRAPLLRPNIFHPLFWCMMTLGFFPFLMQDAAISDMPTNCVILCAVLSVAPLLRRTQTRIIFAASLVINLAASAAAGNRRFHYYLELIVINLIGYLLSGSMHERYYSLLQKQEEQYRASLDAALRQKELALQLEHERDANAAKTKFLARMSHDLRTPLNGVIGMAALAREPGCPRETEEHYLDEIQRSGRYLLGLIDDVLDMSKIECDQISLHPKTCDMREVAATIDSVGANECREKGIRFSADIPVKGPARYVWLDKLRFEQILLNLLSNAIKFTPPGGEIRLEIQDCPAAEGWRSWHILVRDTGIGISQEFLPRVFDSFSQENEDDSRSGTGLGLTIVKRLVELMDGTIRIESAAQRGTDVLVDMPVRTVCPPQQNAAPANKTSLAGRRILLCEDNAVNAEIVRVLLNHENMRVEQAKNERVGLEQFASSPEGYYDAVLMDIRMPEMNGIEAARAIRALPRPDAATVPILALTANAFDEDRRACLAAGMNAHLPKPIEPEELYAALAEFLPSPVQACAPVPPDKTVPSAVSLSSQQMPPV